MSESFQAGLRQEIKDRKRLHLFEWIPWLFSGFLAILVIVAILARMHDAVVMAVDEAAILQRDRWLKDAHAETEKARAESERYFRLLEGAVAAWKEDFPPRPSPWFRAACEATSATARRKPQVEE